MEIEHVFSNLCLEVVREVFPSRVQGEWFLHMVSFAPASRGGNFMGPYTYFWDRRINITTLSCTVSHDITRFAAGV
jgi:hypothetical protein